MTERKYLLERHYDALQREFGKTARAVAADFREQGLSTARVAGRHGADVATGFFMARGFDEATADRIARWFVENGWLQ
jgi:hypothetical protein